MIQQAIAEGADPAEITDAPAAGGAEVVGDSVQGAVEDERTGRVGGVEADYETQGIDRAVDPLVIDSLGLEAAAVDASSDTTAPVVTVSALTTGDSTPALCGTVDDPTATVVVTVNGVEYEAPNNGDGTGMLADDSITPVVADGTLAYSPAENFFGTDTIDYAISNGLMEQMMGPWL